MLRVSSSKIDLSHRDLAWHKERFEKRKTEHEMLVKQPQASTQKARATSPAPCPLVPGRSSTDILLSKTPIMQDCDTFWTTIMADAMSPRIEIPLPLPRTQADCATTDTADDEPSPSGFGELSIQDEYPSQPTPKAYVPSYGLRSLSRFSSGKENEDEIDQLQDELTTFTRQGPSYFERTSRTDRKGKAAVRGARNEEGNFECPSLDGIKEGTRSPNTTLPVLPQAAPSIEKLRTRSGCLPRSPLHVAHAAASSSPAKRGGQSTPSAPINNGTPLGLLSLPPKRQKPPTNNVSPTYRRGDGYQASRDAMLEQEHRSDRSDRVYVGRQDSEQFSSRSETQLLRTLRSTPSRFTASSSDANIMSGSPKVQDQDSDGASGSSTFDTEDSLDDQFEARPYENLPSSPKLPSPWNDEARSLTRRMYRTTETPRSSPPVNISHDADDSRSASSEFSDSVDQSPRSFDAARIDHHVGRRPSTPERPHRSAGPQAPVSAQRTPRTPARQLRVYDDSLPPTSQPQTPIGLPRHGVPPMSMAGSFTAPPARSRIGRLMRPDLARRVDMISRSPAGLYYANLFRGMESVNDQENIGDEGDVESDAGGDRRPRRRAASGNARDILDATPPGEHRRGRGV